MQLKHLLTNVAVERTEGSLEREIAGVTYNSRLVTPGMVFVAIPGQITDGHDYIANAIDRGAAAIICERNGFVAQRAAKIKVKDSREALAIAAAAYYGQPATKLRMIGITGTKGKTTVSFMVKQILETAGVRTGLLGTVRYEIGDRVIPAHRTTPEALEVHQMLAQMLRADCAACVMEVSSHALDQKRVFGIDFDAAIFTNLAHDHLDYHGTMEALIGRHNIYNALAAIGAALVLNIDAKTIQRALNEFRPVPGRLEAIACGQPFGVFVDYAHTEDSLRHVLQTVREISDGRVLVAFGCGGSRDTAKRAKMGRVAAELADFSWITSDNPRKEKPEAIAAQIEEGFRGVRTDCYRVELDRHRAIDEIVREARAGDVVLIAGKGHETYQEFEDTVVPFDDRIYAQETLEALGFRPKRKGAHA
ncbi:MAG: UDP-N-acetylmuramoyl-L-alanyl-D-glutamate--2,6-diaminopimelate ligase [Verrucomicrobia bacterium]|nr:UDP-N-acetylmuramoyl-L-alanyl-D-glutamate--2,6-diaminopimelate ligase [Verrucomicrobiota bacterium]